MEPHTTFFFHCTVIRYSGSQERRQMKKGSRGRNGMDEGHVTWPGKGEQPDNQTDDGRIQTAGPRRRVHSSFKSALFPGK